MLKGEGTAGVLIDRSFLLIARLHPTLSRLNAYAYFTACVHATPFKRCKYYERARTKSLVLVSQAITVKLGATLVP